MREWKQVLEYGERWIEGTFQRRARAMGNDIGYDSIVGGGSHATTLHWIDNTGPIEPGKLVLLDMGVEGRNLYTADVTRTLPVDGTFTQLQRDLYDLVYNAQQTGHRGDRRRLAVPVRAQRGDERARPRSRGPRPAAGLGRGGARPGRRRSTRGGRCTASATCSAWTSTTATAPRPTSTRRATSRSAWCSPSSRGSTSRRTTCWSPRSCAGIGIRIEDDILVTADGPVNLSDSAPPHLGRRRGVDGSPHRRLRTCCSTFARRTPSARSSRTAARSLSRAWSARPRARA